MLGVDHDYIILLSTPFTTIPMFGTNCSCDVIVFYVGNKRCCIVLCRVAWRRVASRGVAWRRVASRSVAWRRVAWRRIVLYCIAYVLYCICICIVLHCVASRRVASYCIVHQLSTRNIDTDCAVMHISRFPTLFDNVVAC